MTKKNNIIKSICRFLSCCVLV